jgi:hypothetical protein
MRIDQIMESLRKDFDGWVKQQRGVLSVAQSPWHALDILCNGPQGLQFVLTYAGDEAEGDLPQEPLGNVAIELIVALNLGLEANRDAALMQNRENRPSLLKLVSDAKARLLAYVFAADEEPQFFAYGGTTTVTMPEGMPLAAYKIRATILEKVEVDDQYRGPGAELLAEQGDT